MKDIHDGKLNNEMLPEEEAERLFAEAVGRDTPDLWDRIAGNLDKALPETDAFERAEEALSKEAFVTVERSAAKTDTVIAAENVFSDVDGMGAANAKPGAGAGTSAKAGQDGTIDFQEIAAKAREEAKRTADKEAAAQRAAESPTTILRGSEVPEESRKSRKKVSGKKSHAMKIWIPVLAAAAIIIAAIPAMGLFGKDKAEKNKSDAKIETTGQQTDQAELSFDSDNETYAYEESVQESDRTGEGVQENKQNASKENKSQGKKDAESVEAATEAAVEPATDGKEEDTTEAVTEAATEAATEDSSEGSGGSPREVRDFASGPQNVEIMGRLMTESTYNQWYMEDYHGFFVTGENGEYRERISGDQMKQLPEHLFIDNPDDLRNSDVLQKYAWSDSGEVTLFGTISQAEDGRLWFHVEPK